MAAVENLEMSGNRAFSDMRGYVIIDNELDVDNILTCVMPAVVGNTRCHVCNKSAMLLVVCSQRELS